MIKIDRLKVYCILADRDETTKELSDAMHITRQRLYQIFKADNIELSTLARMAKALDVNATEIIVKGA